MFKLSVFASLTVTAGLVAAQLSLSSNCQSALTGIVTNTDTANCLNPSALISLALNGGNASIIQPIDQWLTGLCSAAPCSNATLDSATRSIISGCSAELSGLGLTTDASSTDAVVAQVQAVYPTVRRVACLKDSNTLCVTETLTNVQNVLGPLSANNIPGLITAAMTTRLPSNITCSNCVKEAYNVVKRDFPSITADVDPSLQSQCGSSFTDGNTPSGISQSASNASPGTNTANNGAMGSLSALGSLAVSTVFVVSSAFVVLM